MATIRRANVVFVANLLRGAMGVQGAWRADEMIAAIDRRSCFVERLRRCCRRYRVCLQAVDRKDLVARRTHLSTRYDRPTNIAATGSIGAVPVTAAQASRGTEAPQRTGTHLTFGHRQCMQSPMQPMQELHRTQSLHHHTTTRTCVHAQSSPPCTRGVSSRSVVQ